MAFTRGYATRCYRQRRPITSAWSATIVEFILTLVMREAVAKISPSLARSMHLGTKGCICDFTDDLEEARLKVLSAFVCAFCREAMARDGHPFLADEVVRILKRDWFGPSDDPQSPAGISAKLGHNPFTTQGLQATQWDKFAEAAHGEIVKSIVKGIGLLVTASVLVLVSLSGFRH